VKRFVLMAILSVMVVGVSACNTATNGQPSPSVTQTGLRETSTVAGGGNALPVNQACSLLSSSDLEQLGASSPTTQEMVGTAHACEFDSAAFTMALAVRTDVGLAGFTTAGGVVHDTTVGTHQAKQEVDNTGSCVIGIGVSSSSRVDVTVTGDGTSDPCPTALKLANLVEPKLPG
jgi:hypothetical protein